MKSKKRFKIIRIILFLAICAVLSGCLNWITMPPNVVWMNLHKVKEEGPFDYLFIGTSHGQYGISPGKVDEVTGKKSFNLCMADEYPVDTYYLMKDACRKQKPEKIIYELDPSYWILDQRLGSTSIFFYKEFPWSLNKAEYFANKIMELEFRGTLFPWSYYKNNLLLAKETAKKKLSPAYQSHDPKILDVPGGHYADRGFLYQDKVEGADKGTFNNVPWDEGQIRPAALAYFRKMVRFCKEEGIELEVITLPVPADTIANMPDSFRQSDAYFKALTKKYQVPYKNFNFDDGLNIDRSMEGYWDYDGHMYGEEAERFSAELGKYLSENETKKEN